MNSIFSRKPLSGASTLPNSICSPSPLAHHSFEWKPFPAKSTASRTGASLAGLTPIGGVSPQTVSDSIHGSAIVTPSPRRKVRRENWCVLICSMFDVRLLFVSHFATTNFSKLFAPHNRLDRDTHTIILRLELLDHLIDERPIGKHHRATDGVAEQLAAELF